MGDPILRDLAPSAQTFLDAVVAGLSSKPKTLPCKFFYDATGALLFETICTLDAYYVTRTELEILTGHAAAIARELGPAVRLVEPGSGGLHKVRLLLDRLADPVAYVPIDISREQLAEAARVLAIDYPALRVEPVCADYTETLRVPRAGAGVRGTVVFYPGSSIGNFTPDESAELLAKLRAVAADPRPETSAILVGIDLSKDPAILLRAYDDPIGVTAAFNRNLLERINRELGADFDPSAFAHRASYEPAPSRVAMHLVSTRAQRVRIASHRFEFAAGEAVRTEYSHKPSLDDFAATAARAGLRVACTWTDPREWFALVLLRPS